MTEAIVVWWTTLKECAAIGDSLPDDYPVYLRQEYRSRLGRNGRGRIWAEGELAKAWFTAREKQEWPKTPLTLFLQEEAGGIVIWEADAILFSILPGIVTTTKMERYPMRSLPPGLGRHP